MFWQSGDKVYLKHTHQWGVFARYLDHETAMIIPHDDEEEIPVHLDDLDYQAPPASIEEIATPAVPLPTIAVSTDHRGTFPAIGSGVFLGITADPEHMDARKFYMFLINDGPYPMTFESSYCSALQSALQKSGEIQPGEWYELVALSMDQLHHQPEIVINTSWTRTDGIHERPPYSLRPRPRSVFPKLIPNRYFTFPAVFYPLPETTGKKEMVPVHTRRTPHQRSDRAYISATPTPHMRASFDIELDLHAELLFSEPGKVSPADIFKRQMQVFENYLKQAIRVGVPHIFIIHGLGKGKLKKAIAERTTDYPEVNRVRNDYHPKYGFGASEITFYV